jgi:geranylgeranyl pyrophosphate synthase
MRLTFADFAEQCRTQVGTALDAHVAQLSTRAAAPPQLATQLVLAMRYSLFNGGKRVRPTLAYASALAINPSALGTHTALVDRVACALESLHAYSLIHDDLPAMDNDDLRRGKPTCHIAFDEATAILAGDALQTFAFELLSEATDVPAQTQLALIKTLAQASGARGMVLGQAIDLAAVDQDISLAQIETMHRYKTGALIRASVAMGATAVGANAAQLAALDTYAEAIGLAFQVQDDILDVTADTQTLGKQQGADMARNKPTYVSLLGLFGARAKAQELQAQALTALNDFDESAQYLRELAHYIVARKN